MSIEKLTAILPPPLTPVACGGPDGWRTIECQLDIVLPSDYKEFVSTYGVGSINDFLWVLNPFTDNPHINLVSASYHSLNALRRLEGDYGEKLPFPIFPVLNGVFPWGVTDNGDELFWRVHGRACFSIVVMESRAPEWQEFNMSMTGFLTELLTRRITVDCFPDGFLDEPPRFVPLTQT
jgi:hypothetical protein